MPGRLEENNLAVKCSVLLHDLITVPVQHEVQAAYPRTSLSGLLSGLSLTGTQALAYELHI